jgi:hypothetical protein
VVNSEVEAIAALPEILSYDRRVVRRRFEEKFTAARMATDYVSIYRRLLKTRTSDAKLRKVDRTTPLSIEEPLTALFEADASAEVSI